MVKKECPTGKRIYHDLADKLSDKLKIESKIMTVNKRAFKVYFRLKIIKTAEKWT